MGVAAYCPHPPSDIAPRAPLLKVLEITPEPSENQLMEISMNQNNGKGRP